LSQDNEHLSKSLQDNILTLACFSDKSASLIRNSVPITLFTSKPYRTILNATYNYIDRYSKPPKDHIVDELEVLLDKKDDEAAMLSDILASAKDLSASINEEYVLNQLEKFVRQQSLKTGIVKAHELVTQGDLDAAEVALHKAMKARSDVFDPGITLMDVAKRLIAGEDLRDPIATGIDILDRMGLGPARKEFHLFIAPPKRGKSFWLIHIAKRALLQRWKGVYITLELSDKFVGRRELQSLFALTTRENVEETYTKFIVGDKGALEDFEIKKLKRPSLATDSVLRGVPEKIDDLRVNSRLLIKEFPTGSLTIKGLEAYLDNLERTQNFIPDFIILDYADLMYIDPKVYRQALGVLYKELRGIAVERNLAMISASQSNREGADSRIVTDTHVAEDYSKIATVDCVITYNQTPMERMRRLARLYVASGRIEADRFAVLISQSYASGQFILDALPMKEEYWSFMRPEETEED
jgi:replicative DNA helicase